MTIEFRCSQCSQLLRVPDDSAGKNARCPKCQSLMQVPAASQPSSSFTPIAPLPGAGTPPPGPFGPSSPPPPKPTANPFGFQNQPGGGAGGQPPPMPEGSPFGAGGAAAPSLNPYAAPAGGYAYSYQPGYPGASRYGLPWELRPNDFGAWWQTTKLVMLEPTQAFRAMRQYGGLSNPLIYALWGQVIGYLAYMLWNLPIQLFAGLANNNQGDAVVTLIGALVGTVLGLVIVLIILPISIFIGAGVQHVCLRLVGGANQRYETTFRVMCFVQGSFGWLNIVPICGPLVGGIWAIVAMIIGNAHAHECSMGKSVGAFFLSFLIGIVVCVVFYALIIAIVFAALAAGAR